MQFTDLPLTETLQEGLEAMNFIKATPVQEQAIPIILEKKDIIACAQTGTGKTAAFLLPLLNNLLTDKHEENKVNAIIMAPTRELAQQIDQMMEGFSYYTPFTSVAVYGGNDGDAWEVQKKGLMNGADVVIATPGRLLSHINLYNIDFSGVKYLILDEADRMLDMGFYDDIMKIEKLLPKERQTIMFSATMPPKIQELAKSILNNPEEITIAIARPPESIIQSAYICYEAQKIEILKQLFKDKKPNKVILFSGAKIKVKEIAKTLKRMKLSVGEMHSDLDQKQREHIMHEFKNERVDILVATDIVSRGIDIDDITLVINYDVPYDVEDYVHRIGRTARAGDTGMAITFVAPDEQFRFEKIESFLEKNIYKIPVPIELGEAPEYNPKKNARQNGAKRQSTNRKRAGSKAVAGSKESGGSKVVGDSKIGTSPKEKFIDSNEPEKRRSKAKSKKTSDKKTSDKVHSEKKQPSDNKNNSQKNQSTKTNQRSRKKQGYKQKQESTPSNDITINNDLEKNKIPKPKQSINNEQKRKPKQRQQSDQNKKSDQKRKPELILKPKKSSAVFPEEKTNRDSRSKSNKNIDKPKGTSKDIAKDTSKKEKAKKRWSWWPFGKK